MPYPLREIDEVIDPSPTPAFIRFRSGRELGQIIREGVKWKSEFIPEAPRKQLFVETAATNSVKILERESTFSPSEQAETQDLLNLTNHSFDEPEMYKDEGGFESSDGEWDVESVDNLDSIDSQDEMDEVNDLGSSKKRGHRSRNFIGKIAHSVKTKTTAAARTTTSKVVRQSVKVGIGTVNAGKATVNAGKAMIPIRPKKPPIKEPKSSKRSRRHRATGLRVDLNTRKIKQVELFESHLNSSILVGELSAPEQSCRTLSNMMSKISSQPEVSAISETIKALLQALVETSSELDNGFLRGTAAHVGVTP